MTFGRFATLVTIAALALSVGACDRTESSTAPVTSTTPSGSSTAPSPAAAKHSDEALVRVVHAVPGSNLDLFAGDLMLFDGLAFKSVTRYRAIDGERYAFALRPAGMARAKPLSSNTEGLEDGSFYTAFAMPGDGHAPNLRIVKDHLATPAGGKAEVRIVHAGVDAGKIDVREAGSKDPVFGAVDFQTVSDYREVTPINGTIEIAGGNKVLASFIGHLEAGRFYTIVIVGNANGSPGLEAFLIEDALAP